MNLTLFYILQCYRDLKPVCDMSFVEELSETKHSRQRKCFNNRLKLSAAHFFYDERKSMRVKTHKCNNIHKEQQNNVQLLLPRFDGTVKAGYKKDTIYYFFY